METDRIRRYLAKKTRTAIAKTIKDLRVGMSNINLKVRILEVEKPKLVFTRYGNTARFAKAVIADDTGKIKLHLWNEQIDSVSAGDTVKIENAKVSTYRGEIYVNLGKAGTVDNVGTFKTRVKSISQSTPLL